MSNRNNKTSLFNRSIEIGDRLVMEAYDTCISLWDTRARVEVTIQVEDFEQFLKEFNQMVVELRAYVKSKEVAVDRGGKKNMEGKKELEKEIMLDKLSTL